MLYALQWDIIWRRQWFDFLAILWATYLAQQSNHKLNLTGFTTCFMFALCHWDNVRQRVPAYESTSMILGQVGNKLEMQLIRKKQMVRFTAMQDETKAVQVRVWGPWLSFCFRKLPLHVGRYISATPVQRCVYFSLWIISPCLWKICLFPGQNEETWSLAQCSRSLLVPKLPWNPIIFLPTTHPFLKCHCPFPPSPKQLWG